MPSFSTAAWVWMPIVVWAALAQTVRNAAQRTLTTQVGTLPATLVRFLYGLPCAAAWLAVVWPGAANVGNDAVYPVLSLSYALWLSLGAMAQLAATALLLMAMKERNFIVAVTWSKTEILQVALFSVLFLQELPGWTSVVAMLMATGGVLLLSMPKPATVGAAAGAAMPVGWWSRAALYGLGSGALFAMSAVGYRGAALAQVGVSPWLAGAWGVLWAQVMQSVVLGGYLALRDAGGLMAIAKAWRLSLMAGTMGALASAGWFTAMAMRPAAEVRTLGLVEVLFSYVVSRRLFRETLSTAEAWGLVLVTTGLLIVCAQL